MVLHGAPSATSRPISPVRYRSKHLCATFGILCATLAFMVEVRQTAVYSEWFAGLRDRQTKVRIDIRIRRLSLGNPGDVKPVGEGISELRIDYGPGYRMYYLQKDNEFILLLAGGDKASQDCDIREAKALASKV